MQKVIKKLSAENDLSFEEICSFETINYLGIWNHNHDSYVVFEKSSRELWLYEMSDCKSLEELDNLVYELTNEHITGVSDSSHYTFEIHEE